MNTKQQQFISTFLPLARMAGEAFDLNPVLLLAQAAIESGWGNSELASRYCNFFGLSAYGKKNVWWQGGFIELDADSIKFRRYPDASSSFMDYARLIRQAYPAAARLSYDPPAFAQAISYSHTLSEVSPGHRENYRSCLVHLCHQIEKAIRSSHHDLQFKPLKQTHHEC